MRDLFDEFLEELRKRQQGESTGASDAPDELDEPDAADGDAGSHPTTKPRASSGDETKTHDGADDADDEKDAPDSDDGDHTDAAETDEDAADPRFVRIDARRRAGSSGSGSGSGGRGGGGGRRRRQGGPNDGGSFRERFGRMGRRILLIVLAILLIFLFTIAGSFLDLWTDLIWFRSVGFDGVFITQLSAQVVLFIVGLVIGLLVLLGNLWIAGRLSPPPDPSGRGSLSRFFERFNEAGGQANDRNPFGGFGGYDRGGGFRGRVNQGGYGSATFEFDEIPDLTPIGRWLVIGLAILIALGVGVSLAGSWETILLWQHQVPYSPNTATPVTDPIFGRDIGFFLFELPFLRLVQSAANDLLLATLFVTFVRYGIGAFRGSFAFSTPIRVHLAVIGGLYLLTVAAGYQLDKFELVYSTQGVAAGVSYTDFHARFFGLDALTVIAAVAAALLVGGAFTRLIWPLGFAVGAWLVAAVVLLGIYPQFVQRFTVDPNRFAEEQPFITNNIKETRLAYLLDQWQSTDYQGDSPLTAQVVQQEAATFQNARLWDYRPLGSTLDQIQTVRQYYDFTNIDTDRYTIDGQARQVMLSARELAQEKTDQSSWVNQRLTYTHGVGVAMVPVNEVTPEGLPQLLIHDLPPVSAPSVPTITQSGIYFGERPSDYVIVDARQPEFDYPASGTASSGGTDQGTQTSWQGTTGISLDSTLTRLLFALRFRDLNLLISDQITPQSQLLMHRSLSDRVERVAPFLAYDHDPYLVVDSKGKLWYIQDAYTLSDRFPNAQPTDPSTLPSVSGLRNDSFDYLRNSVKVVVNAYDGTMTFYAADPSDPILRAYEGVFPTLFKPLSEMPADLQAHLRVPEDLFDVQTRQYATYHVTDEQTFFRGSDLWTVPTTAGSEQSLPNEAYYVEMRLPNESNTEFLLLQPMVPAGRPNMIAWVAARNDAPNYGSVEVFRFPQDTAVRGPNQIEAQISADPTISSQITLWNQSGSTVVRGNLIVMPVQNTVVYIQPIYLQATASAFPAFQKIVVATSTKIVWGNTLAEALTSLLAGGSGAPTPTPTPAPSPGASGSPPPSGSPPASTGPTPQPTVAPSGAIPPPPAGDVAALIAYANFHFEQAQAALRIGDFARYGQEIAAVQQALQLLSQLVPPSAGVPSLVPSLASPAPSAVTGSAAPSASP
jgi:uncharacterized membrane protein (UPF0182 family)